MRGVEKHGATWRVNTTIDKRRVVQGGFKDAESAWQWLQAKRKEQPEQGLLVSDIVQFYLQHRPQERHQQLAAHLLEHLGPQCAGLLRQVDTDAYTSRRGREAAAPKTIWNELAMLRTALRYAWRNDMLSDPPRFVLQKPRCARCRVAWPKEAQQLVRAAGLPLRRVVYAAWTRGLRRAEIINARWEWLHGETLVLPDTKTGVPKEVPLSPSLLAMLRRGPVSAEWLWANRTGGKWSKSALRRAWVALCERCGVSGLTFHDLRRSMASVGLSLGHAPAAVQAVGGWADQVALMRHYSHAQGPQARAVVADLEGRVDDV
jgi:integrase